MNNIPMLPAVMSVTLGRLSSAITPSNRRKEVGYVAFSIGEDLLSLIFDVYVFVDLERCTSQRGPASRAEQDPVPRWHGCHLYIQMCGKVRNI